MAIILHKNGEIQIANEFSYLHLLDDGWSYEKNLKLAVKKPIIKEQEVKPEVKPEVKKQE